MAEKLNGDDIALLMEALDSLEHQAKGHQVFAQFIGVITSENEQQARDRYYEATREFDPTLLGEQIILTKAKLIKMKSEVAANEAQDFLDSQQEG